MRARASATAPLPVGGQRRGGLPPSRARRAEALAASAETEADTDAEADTGADGEGDAEVDAEAEADAEAAAEAEVESESEEAPVRRHQRRRRVSELGGGRQADGSTPVCVPAAAELAVGDQTTYDTQDGFRPATVVAVDRSGDPVDYTIRVDGRELSTVLSRLGSLVSAGGAAAEGLEAGAAVEGAAGQHGQAEDLEDKPVRTTPAWPELLSVGERVALRITGKGEASGTVAKLRRDACCYRKTAAHAAIPPMTSSTKGSKRSTCVQTGSGGCPTTTRRRRTRRRAAVARTRAVVKPVTPP
ncbi:hypothetical protein T492DRAFT_1057191 [Pavlovales sp. CCMP2436]|nr:hypothetical protein T492DRAFT_1057191 [Pavlovales sp. CCMP2436]|mmetsp:Transcript_47469/g.109219  ORF Transcript_47469/g.109219 Transcript_47469/m.109219 type:complete len:301 (-) Transcript_47469:314-1216(-)